MRQPSGGTRRRALRGAPADLAALDDAELGIVVMGSTLTALLLFAMGRADKSVKTSEQSAYRLAFLVALGIGLHNLGEGLAVGSAYATGEVALGTFLVLGFLLHNTTEGLAIVTPLASGKPRTRVRSD